MLNETVIESGKIKNHHRRDGWNNLVGMLLANSFIMRGESEAVDEPQMS
jgi:hypothetical protein